MSKILLNGLEIRLSYKEKEVFKDLNLNLLEGAKIGLVGVNGAGKTSLLKILAGILEPDEGEILKPNDLQIHFLPQDYNFPKNTSIGDFVLPKISHDSDIYLEKLKQMEDLYPNFRLPPFDTLLNNLSGGQQRQVLLLQAFLSQSQLLLLDEPTNHLDLQTTENVKNLLLDFPGTYLLISHDRYFIDQVTNGIWELEAGKLFQHKGNYSSYLKSRENRLETEKIQYQKRQQELRREAEWAASGVKARGTKDFGRLQRYEVLKELQIETKPRYKKPYLPLPKPLPLGNKILKLEDLAINKPDSQDLLFAGLNLEFHPGMKVGLLGPNGSGKTTLIKTILGVQKKSKGKIIIGLNTSFNYQDQRRVQVDENKTIMQNLSGNNIKLPFGDGSISVYAYLKKFLFTPEQIRNSASGLSGGQKARLMLAKILHKGGNFLILDEPTNDLDLDTLEALENSLIDFQGCVLLVSHDRFFMDRVCTHILALDGHGGHQLSTGGYSEFIKKFGDPVLSKVNLVTFNNPSKKINSKKTKNNKDKEEIEKNIFQDYQDYSQEIETSSLKISILKNPKLIRKQKVRLKELETEISILSLQVRNLEAETLEQNFYNQNPQEVQRKLEKLQKLKIDLENKESEWFYLAEILRT